MIEQWKDGRETGAGEGNRRGKEQVNIMPRPLTSFIRLHEILRFLFVLPFDLCYIKNQYPICNLYQVTDMPNSLVPNAGRGTGPCNTLRS